MVQIKYKDFIDVVTIMPCQNSPWIIGSRIYGERRAQISLSSLTDPLLIIILWFLLTNSPEKLKLGKINVTLIIIFYLNPSSSQLQIIFFFLLKAQKIHSWASYWWECTNSCFKKNARAFSKTSTTQKNIRTSRLKTYYKTSTKKKISN